MTDFINFFDQTYCFFLREKSYLKVRAYAKVQILLRPVKITEFIERTSWN